MRFEVYLDVVTKKEIEKERKKAAQLYWKSNYHVINVWYGRCSGARFSTNGEHTTAGLASTTTVSVRAHTHTHTHTHTHE